MKLYEISEAIQRLIEASLDPETGEIGALAEEDLDKLAGDRDKKLLDIACLIKSMEAEAAAHEDEERKQAAHKRQLRNRADWLRNYAVANMPADSLHDARIKLTRLAPRKIVEVLVKPEELPAEFQRVKIEPNKTLIADALKSRELPFARMSDGKPSLKIT